MRNASQINISGNQVENVLAYSANQYQLFKLFLGSLCDFQSDLTLIYDEAADLWDYPHCLLCFIASGQFKCRCRYL